MNSTTMLQMLLIGLSSHFLLGYGEFIRFTKVLIVHLYYVVKLTSYWDFSSQNDVMDRDSRAKVMSIDITQCFKIG